MVYGAFLLSGVPEVLTYTQNVAVTPHHPQSTSRKGRKAHPFVCEHA